MEELRSARESFVMSAIIYPVREQVSASARNADIKIVGSERERCSVYEGSKIYLLNTDYDVPAVVKVISKDEEKTVTIEPLELKNIMVDNI